jgi:hypothetical protein
MKLGKRAGLTIRQLGYPTNNALKALHQADQQRQDLPKGYVREPKYTPAQRQLAVDHFVANGRCLAVMIKALGYPSRSLLAGWIRDAHPEVRPRVGQLEACDQDPRDRTADQGDDSIGREPVCFVSALEIFGQ